ncbi:MAG TPA: zinc-ribbon domain-containing protein [Blastocatellia bacterium]|nr:zinc-ribbon domain-containing protein [Blastocatellia bacterium]
MFTAQWQSWLLLALGLFLGVIVPSTVIFVVMYIGLIAAAEASRGASGAEALPVVVLLMGAGLMFLLMPVAVFLTGGLWRSAFKQLRGGRLEFKDLFSGGDCFFRVLGATIVVGLLVMVATMLCIIPGFIVSGLLFFTVPLIVERRMGVFEAMGASYEATKPNLLMFTLFAFVVSLIASAGYYACYVGLLATYPLLFTMTAVAYRDCFGLPGAVSFLPPPPRDLYAPPPPVASAPLPTTARRCSNCQAELPAAATFCPRCGAGNR